MPVGALRITSYKNWRPESKWNSHYFFSLIFSTQYETTWHDRNPIL